MPATTPEAIARKSKRNTERKRRLAEARRAELAKTQNLTLPSHKVTARRMLPKIGDLSKAELREMLATAAANTARM